MNINELAFECSIISEPHKFMFTL